jgi:glycosyltransferase involved in cell wall biosynthesis
LGKDYEIICVNDGSTDNSLQILTQFADNQEFSRGGYCIVNQQNSGVSAARNNGLEHAQGDYVWFVDSDDFIKENVLDSLIQFMDKNPCDCYMLDFCKVNESVEQNKFVYDTEEFHRIDSSQWQQGRRYNYTWIRIISRDFLQSNEIKFNVDVTHQEDTLWVFWLSINHCSYCYTDQVVYAYRQRLTSAMHQVNHNDYFNSMIALTNTYKEALDKYQDKITASEQRHIKLRLYWSTQNVLFFAMRMTKPIRKQTLQTLIADGLYPYPILWSRLSVHYGIKNLLINLIGLFIPCKYYYYFMGYIFDIIRKLK